MIAALLALSFVFVQPTATPSGHWEGSLQVPGQELKIQVDLAVTGEKWDGTISIPAQNMRGFPLSAITVQGDKVSFAMKGVPGAPQFNGTLSKDGKGLSGDFTQGGATFPFTLARTGEAKIEAQQKSTPITKELEGSWEGPLNVDGTTLRLLVKLANSTDGIGSGTLVSLDQGNAEIPIATVLQTGARLKLLLPAIAANYEGI
jgi:hypothetical protein